MLRMRTLAVRRAKAGKRVFACFSGRKSQKNNVENMTRPSSGWSANKVLDGRPGRVGLKSDAAASELVDGECRGHGGAVHDEQQGVELNIFANLRLGAGLPKRVEHKVDRALLDAADALDGFGRAASRQVVGEHDALDAWVEFHQR